MNTQIEAARAARQRCNPGPDHREGVAMAQRTCSIDDCDRPYYGRGWCNAHYARWRRHGDPQRGGTVRDLGHESMWDVSTERRGDCLIWTGDVQASGYGRIYVDGVRVPVHRYAWERANGPIPDGMVIDHTCHTPACVEASHLRPVTHARNMQNRSGAQRNSASGIRNVYRRKNGFAVQIQVNRKPVYFGTYATEREAAEVAEARRRELFGDFAGRG